MKRIILMAALGIVSGSLYAQHEGHNHGTEQVKVETTPVTTPAPDNSLVMKEESFDFGKIPQGKPVTHVFELQNAGKTSMKLVNVQASCGCTTPEWEKDKEIAAGGSSNIKVGYNAANEGPFTKSITITYNDNQTKQIIIKGEVWKTPAASAPNNAAAAELKD